MVWHGPDLGEGQAWRPLPGTRVIPIAVSTAGARRAVGLWPPVSRSVVRAGGRSGSWLGEARSTPRRCVQIQPITPMDPSDDEVRCSSL